MELNYTCYECNKTFVFDNSKDVLHFVCFKGSNRVFCSLECKLKKKTKHKFNAQQCERDGRKFSSKLEARYYDYLEARKKSGEVVFFLSQVAFHLPGNVKYVCDFQVFNADGTVQFIDTKGLDTPLSIAKRKIVEGLYPIEIKIVK